MSEASSSSLIVEGRNVIVTEVFERARNGPVTTRSSRPSNGPYRETARMALEPWIVEAALARLPRTLSPADQRIVIKATRAPHKVRWPDWWSEHP